MPLIESGGAENSSGLVNAVGDQFYTFLVMI